MVAVSRNGPRFTHGKGTEPAVQVWGSLNSRPPQMVPSGPSFCSPRGLRRGPEPAGGAGRRRAGARAPLPRQAPQREQLAGPGSSVGSLRPVAQWAGAVGRVAGPAGRAEPASRSLTPSTELLCSRRENHEAKGPLGDAPRLRGGGLRAVPGRPSCPSPGRALCQRRPCPRPGAPWGRAPPGPARACPALPRATPPPLSPADFPPPPRQKVPECPADPGAPGSSHPAEPAFASHGHWCSGVAGAARLRTAANG